MTPVSDLVFDTLHSTATEIFTGALAACDIDSAFDRRLHFEGNVMQRLLPDGSGPDSIDLANYKRIFVIALGKAAEPMLDILLTRMKRRKGLRGICCTNQQPRKRNWRIRYFEGGHPLPNEDSFAAARAAEPKQVALVPGADHFFTGHLQRMQSTLAGWLKEQFS